MLIGLCGGIGSGKSMVSRILRLKGFRVFDCDYEARLLMEEDARIKIQIRDNISAEATDGVSPPDRKLLADIIFNDEEARLKLNRIVHEAVFRKVIIEAHRQSIMWVEAAILSESGLAGICDRIWKIESPLALRIQRSCMRDGCSSEEIIKRISSQNREEELLKSYQAVTQVVLNDETHSLMACIDNLLMDIISD
ncbi:MAG: dephospho-CoA kinase [Muribaculaceae bacterium]|nr:dephospho-CoA kinase [Muribaculaceae bacterium]